MHVDRRAKKAYLTREMSVPFKRLCCCAAAAALAACDAGFYESITFPARKHRTMYAITTTVISVDERGNVTSGPYQPETETRFTLETSNSSPVKAGAGESVRLARQPGIGSWIIFSTTVDGEPARLAAAGGALSMPARDVSVEVKLFHNPGGGKAVLLEKETSQGVSYESLSLLEDLFAGGGRVLEPDGDAENPPNRAFLLSNTYFPGNEQKLGDRYALRLTSAEDTKAVTFTPAGYVRVEGSLSMDALIFDGNGSATEPIILVTGNDSKLILNDGAVLRNRENIGAVHVGKFGAFEMHSGLITGNSATSDVGGAVLLVDGGKFEMSGGRITGNHAASNSGGAVFLKQSDENEFIMSGGSITGNSADGYGGAVFVHGGQFTLSGGSITGNSAGRGGAVYVSSSGAEARFIMTGGSVTGNSASWGGGVYVEAQFEMSGGVISGNRAGVGADGSGGGVCVEADEPAMVIKLSGAAFVSPDNDLFFSSSNASAFDHFIQIAGALTPPPPRPASALIGMKNNFYSPGVVVVKSAGSYTLRQSDLNALPLSNPSFYLRLNDRGDGEIARR